MKRYKIIDPPLKHTVDYWNRYWVMLEGPFFIPWDHGIERPERSDDGYELSRIFYGITDGLLHLKEAHIWPSSRQFEEMKAGLCPLAGQAPKPYTPGPLGPVPHFYEWSRETRICYTGKLVIADGWDSDFLDYHLIRELDIVNGVVTPERKAA